MPGRRGLRQHAEAGRADRADDPGREHHCRPPNYTGSPATVGYNGANITGITMTVERRDDGSVVADCHTDS
jgi:hypothetical protein